MSARPGQQPVSAPLWGGTLRDVPRLNLLPEPARVRLIARRRQRVWLAAVGVSVALVLLASHWSHVRAAEARGLRAALAQVTRAVRQEEQQAKLLAARAQVAGKRQELLEAMRATASWAHSLAGLARCVPDNLVITQLSVQARRPPAEGPPASKTKSSTPAPPPAPSWEVRVSGVAADHATLAILIHRLQHDVGYERVDLVRSAAQNSGSSSLLDFEVVCRR